MGIPNRRRNWDNSLASVRYFKGLLRAAYVAALRVTPTILQRRKVRNVRGGAADNLNCLDWATPCLMHFGPRLSRQMRRNPNRSGDRPKTKRKFRRPPTMVAIQSGISWSILSIPFVSDREPRPGEKASVRLANKEALRRRPIGRLAQTDVSRRSDGMGGPTSLFVGKGEFTAPPTRE